MTTVGLLAVLATTVVAARPAGSGHDGPERSTQTPATSAVATIAEEPGALRDAVRLRLLVGTSSDWSVVKVSPGDVLAATVVSSNGNARVDRHGAAWSVSPVDPTKQAWVAVEAVIHEPAGEDHVTLTIDKGYRGRTFVRMIDVQRDATVLEATNDRHSLVDPSNRQTWTLARQDVYAEPIDLPKATADPKVLAFYYPWFDRYDDPKMTDQPAVPRSTFKGPDVRDMTRQAAAHGIDGFVVSWAGEQADGYGFEQALVAAEAEGQTAAGYLEVARAPALTRSVTVFTWLQELLERAESSPAYLRHDGVPVVFVYAMEELPVWWWRVMHDRLADAGRDVLFVGDTGRPEYAEVTWGEHRYSALGSKEERAAHGRRQALALRAATAVEGAEPMAWVATVAPGYDDHLVRDGNPVVDRAAGQRYTDTWDAALVSDPDWIVVTSWNEWYEGTSIEPSVNFGDFALRQTRERSEAWTGGTG